MRHPSSPERAGQVAAAVARAVRVTGSPAAPDVVALLHTFVQDLLDEGGTMSEVLDGVGALFEDLRAQHDRADVRVALGVLLTQTRSHALELAYTRPDREPGA